MNRRPKVSILTPTRDRAAWLPAWWACIQAQDWPTEHLEVLVLDDGRTSVQSQLEALNPSIRYLHTNQRTPLGSKRNLLCEAATGDIFIHFDDDDWHAPTRISRAVAALEAEQTDVTGRSDIAVWDLHARATFLTPSIGKKHAMAGTLAYRRNYWREHPYSTEPVHEERQFLRNFDTPLAISPGAPQESLVAIFHGENARLRTHAYPKASDPIEAWIPEDARARYLAIDLDDAW